MKRYIDDRFEDNEPCMHAGLLLNVVARCVQCACAVLSTPFFDLCYAIGDVNVPGCVLGMERGFLAWRGS